MNEIQFEREKESLQTEYLLKSAVLQSLERDLAAFDAVGTAQAAPEELKKMDQAFARGVKNGIDSIPERAKKRRLIRHISLLTAMFLIVFAPWKLYANASIRSGVANFLITNFPQFSTIHYDSDQNARLPVGWENKVYPLVVPEGFYYIEMRTSEYTSIIRYSSNEGREFLFMIFSDSSNLGIDTENMTAEKVKINDYDATLFRNADRTESMLLFTIFDNLIIIRGQLTKDEIFQIAEHLSGMEE